MFQKILICVNESDFSEKVARTGADIARRFHADVVVLSVLDAAHFVEPPYSGLEAGNMIDHYSRSLTRVAHRVGVMLETMNIRNKVIFLPGRTAKTILEVAKQEKVDLVVMGGETRGRLRSWFEGNLWNDVSRSAPCNVLRVSPDSETGILIPPMPGEHSLESGRASGYANPLGDAVS